MSLALKNLITQNQVLRYCCFRQFLLLDYFHKAKNPILFRKVYKLFSDNTFNMPEVKRLSVEIINAVYPIGKRVYVPQKNGAAQTEIVGYEVQVIKENAGLVGVVSNYRLPLLVSVRRGEEPNKDNLVKPNEFYTNKNKAEAASKFMQVTADDETWRLAIGDRKIKEEDSPYNIDNCGLPTCCANISEARDILSFCRREGGLIAHERNILADLLTGDGFEYDSRSPIGKVLSQLGI